MARTCTTCVHDRRAEIDAALIAGEPFRHIAARFDTSTGALQRHKADHLPGHLLKAREAEEVAEADDLLGQVRDLQARTLAILEAAEGSSQHRTALSAIREARSNLELLAKLVGELDERPVNVLVAPEWLELRAVIVGALQPHTEARDAVLRALEGPGNGRA